MNALGSGSMMSAAKSGFGNMGMGNIQDLKNTVLGYMRELNKKNKMINKKDIYTVLQSKVDHQSFEEAIQNLMSDGEIYTVYGDDVFALNE